MFMAAKSATKKNGMDWLTHGTGLKLNTVAEKEMLEGIAIEDRIDDASCRGNVSLLRPRVPHIVFRSFQIVAPHCNGIPAVACFLNGVTIVAWYRM